MENKKLKVILVDDDRTVGNLITDGLMYLGYDVHYQTSLVAIKALILEYKPNVIILDVEIGDINGIDASAEIRESFPNIPIIFISSHIESSFVAKALKSGGVIYLKKPVEIEDLAAYINRYATKEIKEIVRIGQFTLNLKNTTLENTKTNTTQKLSSKECELLYILYQNIDRITTRDEILEKLWNGDHMQSQILSNKLVNIRKYLSDDTSIQIVTRPREGYILKITAEQ